MLAQSEYKMHSLNKKYNKMVSEVEQCRTNRNEVVEKKFSDPAFVSSMCNLITDVLANRDTIKKKFVKYR